MTQDMTNRIAANIRLLAFGERGLLGFVPPDTLRYVAVTQI